MKIAIVHEMLIKLGGAERVLLEFMEMYPEADVFTLMYDERKVGSVFPKNKIHCTGPAQRFFQLTGKPRASLPFMAWSARSIDLRGYDLVISSSSGFAHGVKVQSAKYKAQNEGILTNSGTENLKLKTENSIPRHICYCHSPARYLWDWTEQVQQEFGILRPFVRLLFSWLRRVDLRASKSPDMYIANSGEVQARIQKYYGRDSVVLWPPIETSRFHSGKELLSRRKYYVMTSALTPFKRVDIPVRVLTELGISLKIIGTGDQFGELKKLAGPTIEFLGRLSDNEVVEIYKNARGFLMPQKEDAGMAPIEAMAAGLPIFGQAVGGLLESNIDGVTGRFFSEETDESFRKGFIQFHEEIEQGKYDDPRCIIDQAKRFDRENFGARFRAIVGDLQ